MRVRAGVILVQEGRLALIERHVRERHYFSFPGGGVDEGETFAQAAVRETFEELGVIVRIEREAAQVVYRGSTQHYYLVTQTGGAFGQGTGEEYGGYDPKFGTYEPVWMALEEITEKNVVPKPLAEFVQRCAREGWPGEVEVMIEEGK